MLARIEAALEDLGDRINPILVKETRQALKSRQFLFTFLFLLVAAVVMSFAGVALSGPGLAYRSAGSEFFIAFFVVLAFAVFVVVPFGAYRSLAAEHEEHTYELLSISKLKPRQIVGGKLLSAIIQMFIFYSAVAPFMAFTLLLKGIDVVTISIVLVLSALVSIALSMTGLLQATFAVRKGWQVFYSVTTVAALLFAGIILVIVTAVTLFQPIPVRDPEFWTVLATALTVFATYFWIAFQLAAARLTFEADNRSRGVRLSLLTQFLLLIGWSGYWWMAAEGKSDVALVLTILLAVHWFFVGSLLVAERPGLSQRVLRQIPRARWARALVTLLLPGPGTGLAFLGVILLTLLVLGTLGEVLRSKWWPAAALPGPGSVRWTYVLTAVSYVWLYCAFGAAWVRALRRRWPLPVVGGAAMCWLLTAAGILVPSFFALILPDHQFQDYRVWQISDPIATLVQVHRAPATLSLPLIVAGIAVLALLVNVRAMGAAVIEAEPR